MFKKEDKFITKLKGISADVLGGTKQFTEAGSKNCTNEVHNFEHQADEKVESLIKMLNTAFITPIEREDILAMTLALDEIIDGVYHCAELREIVGLNNVNEHEEKFAIKILEAVKIINASIELLETKKLDEVAKNNITVKRIEMECDKIYRTAVKELFANEKDVLEVMKRKEMYDMLENVADECKEMAKVLDSVVMKNA